MGMRLVALLAMLATAGAEGPVDSCIDALRSGNPDAESRLLALGPDAFGPVAQLLEGRDPVPVKRAAARVLLAYSGRMESLEPHADRLARTLDDEDPRVRAAAGTLLLRAGPKNVAALERAFAGKHDDGRAFAARALGRLGTAALPAIRKNIASDSSRRRAAAAEAAGYLGPDAAEFVPALQTLLADKDGGVQRSAALALGRLRAAPEKTVPMLLERAGDVGPQRWVCAEALAAYGAAALPQVVAAIERAEEFPRDILLVAIEALPQDAWPAFAEALRKASPDARAAMLEALPQAEALDLEAWGGPTTRLPSAPPSGRCCGPTGPSPSPSRTRRTRTRRRAPGP
jgi:HEAT repeat protein